MNITYVEMYILLNYLIYVTYFFVMIPEIETPPISAEIITVVVFLPQWLLYDVSQPTSTKRWACSASTEETVYADNSNQLVASTANNTIPEKYR